VKIWLPGGERYNILLGKILVEFLLPGMPKKILFILILIIGFGLLVFNFTKTKEAGASGENNLNLYSVLRTDPGMTEQGNVPIIVDGEAKYTPHIISDIAYGTEISLVAPDTYVYNGVTFHFYRWLCHGYGYIWEKNITVSVTDDMSCWAEYDDWRRWICRCHEEGSCEYITKVPQIFGAATTRKYHEDRTGTHDCIVWSCWCPETGYDLAVVHLQPKSVDPDAVCNERGVTASCPSGIWEACSVMECTWYECRDCGITCNPDYPEICCDNRALTWANCQDCIPPKVLNVSSGPGGSVTTPGEGTFEYLHGTIVDLIAVADEGYQFDEWTGDCSGTECQVEMTENRSVTANFKVLELPHNLNVKSRLYSRDETITDAEVPISSNTGHGGDN